MLPQTPWQRFKAGVLELAQLTRDGFLGLGRLLARGFAWCKPHLKVAWTRVLALWNKVSPRLRAIGARIALFLRRFASRVIPLFTRFGRPALRVAVLALLIGGASVFAAKSFVHTVPVGSIGVRQSTFGGAGVAQEDFGAGLHTQLWGRDEWLTLPAGTHLISFAGPKEGGSHAPLEVATLEGESCQVNVIVPYRIAEGRGWKLVADGLRMDYPGRAVAICRRVLLEELGRLSAEDYANPDARRAGEERAMERLTAELGATHLAPLDVRIGTVLFNPTYEKKMLEAQLGRQEALAGVAIEQRAEEQRLRMLEQQKIDDRTEELHAGFALQREALADASEEAIASAQREAAQYAARIHSETEVALLSLKNEGELALVAAEDLKRSLFDAALESEGGQLHVARAAAENLKFGRVTLNSNDPRVPSVLDLDELVGLLMGGRAGQ